MIPASILPHSRPEGEAAVLSRRSCLAVQPDTDHERYLFREEADRQRNGRLQGGEGAAGAPGVPVSSPRLSCV